MSIQIQHAKGRRKRETNVLQDRNGFYRHVGAHPRVVHEEEKTPSKTWRQYAGQNGAE
jgi:hypothetical protein